MMASWLTFIYAWSLPSSDKFVTGIILGISLIRKDTDSIVIFILLVKRLKLREF